jgi:NitT/TauT family transport system substrate-binding protein
MRAESRRRWVRGAAAAALAFLLSACPREPAEPLRVGTNHWPGYEPLYLARDLKLAPGLEWQLHEQTSGSATMAAFRNRSIDAAAVTLDETLLLLQDGLDVRVVLVLDVSHGADVLMARPDIATLADLRGKRIGVESSALGAYVLTRALQAAGLAPGQVVPVPVAADQHERAYLDRRVDAVVTFEPVKARLSARGAKVLFDSSQIPEEIVDVLVIHADVLARRGRAVAALVEGWYRGLEHLQSGAADPSRLARRYGVPPGEAMRLYEGFRLVDRDWNQRFLGGPRPALLAAAERLAQVMRRSELLRRDVEPARLLAPAPSARSDP